MSHPLKHTALLSILGALSFLLSHSLWAHTQTVAPSLTSQSLMHWLMILCLLLAFTFLIAKIWRERRRRKFLEQLIAVDHEKIDRYTAYLLKHYSRNKKLQASHDRLLEQINRENRAFDQLLESLPFPVYLKDRNGQILYVNRRFVNLFELKGGVSSWTEPEYQRFIHMELMTAGDTRVLNHPETTQRLSVMIPEGTRSVALYKTLLPTANDSSRIFGVIIDYEKLPEPIAAELSVTSEERFTKLAMDALTKPSALCLKPDQFDRLGLHSQIQMPAEVVIQVHLAWWRAFCETFAELVQKGHRLNWQMSIDNGLNQLTQRIYIEPGLNTDKDWEAAKHLLRKATQAASVYPYDCRMIEEVGALELHLNLPLADVSRPFSVLLVDDLAMNREVLNHYIQNMLTECNILEAGDGQQALNLINESHVDLVLMDLRMPGMNGVEATRHIRADWLFAELPVFAVSANIDARNSEELALFQALIAKPVQPADLEKPLKNQFPSVCVRT